MTSKIAEDLRWAASDRYALLKDFARKNRMNPTIAEILLWQELRDQALGTKFFRQYVIADYIVDFVSLQHRLIIEVDGAYHSESEQKTYDEDRTSCLKRLGFQVIRFTNEEIQNSIKQVLTTIKEHLNNERK